MSKQGPNKTKGKDTRVNKQGEGLKSRGYLLGLGGEEEVTESGRQSIESKRGGEKKYCPCGSDRESAEREKKKNTHCLNLNKIGG